MKSLEKICVVLQKLAAKKGKKDDFCYDEMLTVHRE